eukprot:6823594-Prymnesium_polylepis.2
MSSCSAVVVALGQRGTAFVHSLCGLVRCGLRRSLALELILLKRGCHPACQHTRAAACVLLHSCGAAKHDGLTERAQTVRAGHGSPGTGSKFNSWHAFVEALRAARTCRNDVLCSHRLWRRLYWAPSRTSAGSGDVSSKRCVNVSPVWRMSPR